MGTHFLDQQKGLKTTLNTWIERVEKGLDSQLQAELNVDYQQIFGSMLAIDYELAPDEAKKRLLIIYRVTKDQIEVGSAWLNKFLEVVQAKVKSNATSSDRITVRVGIGNHGFQDGLISAEARLQVGNKSFRLPIRTASRPWESEDAKGLQNYYILKAQGFQVLDFVVDKTFNAAVDVDWLHQELNRGVQAKFQALGIGHKVENELKFQASLPHA